MTSLTPAMGRLLSSNTNRGHSNRAVQDLTLDFQESIPLVDCVTLRSLVLDSLSKQMHKTAQFYAERLIHSHSSTINDMVLYGRCYYCSGEYRRCLALLENEGMLSADVMANLAEALNPQLSAGAVDVQDVNTSASASKLHNSTHSHSHLDIDASSADSTPSINHSRNKLLNFDNIMGVEALTGRINGVLLAAQCLLSLEEYDDCLTLLETIIVLDAVPTDSPSNGLGVGLLQGSGINQESSSIKDAVIDRARSIFNASSVSLMNMNLNINNMGSVTGQSQSAASSINAVAGLYAVAGYCLDILDNRLRAMRSFVSALRIDAGCIEVVEYIVNRSLLSPSERKELLSLITRDQYTSRMRFDDKCIPKNWRWLLPYYKYMLGDGTPEDALKDLSASVNISSSSLDVNEHDNDTDPRVMNNSMHHQDTNVDNVLGRSQGGRSVGDASVGASVGVGADTNSSINVTSANPTTPAPSNLSSGMNSNLSSGIKSSASKVIDEMYLGVPERGLGGWTSDGTGPVRSSIWLFRRAEHALDRQQYEDAYRLARAAYTRDPFFERGLFVYIAAMVELSLKTELFYLGHELVNTYPKQAISWYAVGSYYWICEKYEAAQKFLQKATKLDRRMHYAWIALGHVLAAQEENEHAISAYRAASRLVPGDHRPLCFMGKELVRTSNLTLGLHILQVAHRICCSDVAVMNELGVGYMAQEDLDKAHHYLSVASDSVWNRLGGRILLEGAAVGSKENIENRDGGIETPDSESTAGQHHGHGNSNGNYKYSSQLKNGNGYSDSSSLRVAGIGGTDEIMSNFATCLRKMKRLDDALMWYNRCLSIRPNCAATHASRGFTLHQQGCFDEAIEAYHRALTLQPSNIFCTDMLTKALNDINSFNANARVVGVRHIGHDVMNNMDLPPPRPPPSSQLKMSSSISMHMPHDSYGAGRGVGAGGEVFSPPAPPTNDNNIMTMSMNSPPPPPSMEEAMGSSYLHPHAQGEQNYSYSRISHAGLDIDEWTGGTGSRPPSAPPSAPASGTRSRTRSGSTSGSRSRSGIGSASRSTSMIDYRSQHYFGNVDDSGGIITAQNESGQDDSASSISYTRIANRLSLDSSDASSRIV